MQSRGLSHDVYGSMSQSNLQGLRHVNSRIYFVKHFLGPIVFKAEEEGGGLSNLCGQLHPRQTSLIDVVHISLHFFINSLILHHIQILLVMSS